MEILKVENLSKVYGKGETKIKAVDDISFSVEKGDFVAIVGASGSGKSTLLHLLGGVDRPTKGKVFIDGVDIYAMDNDALAIFRRRQVGLIYQFYNLIPILDVEENITLPAKLDGTEVDKKHLNDLLETLGLENRKKHLPNELSGGQQQRVSIARAITKNPEILLCDEPTGALDSETGCKVLQLIQDVCREFQKTVIIVTHNSNIAKVADKVIRLKNGKILEISLNDSPADIKEVEW